MTKYKLVPYYKEQKDIQVWKMSNGMKRLTKIRLYPGKTYKVEDEGDSIFINELKNIQDKEAYSKQLESELKEIGINYEIKKSSCCGGRRQNIYYNVVEVFTDI